LVGLGKESAPAHCGVGTLVRLRENHYILTAAHCARPLAKCGEVGIPVGGRYYIRFPVLPPIYVGQSRSAEWGPDLAFLHVPPVKVGEITAISSSLLYDLAKNAKEMLEGEPEIDKGLWTIVGTPACLSNLEDQNNLSFTKMTYLGGVASPIIKDDFYYIEIRANLGLNTVPPSFKGLSGGGLWQTEVGRKPDGALLLIGKPRLEGCLSTRRGLRANALIYVAMDGAVFMNMRWPVSLASWIR
jgi:hypothetical protein